VPPSKRGKRPEDVPTNREPELNAKAAEREGSLVVLALVSLLGGAASGLLGAVFRLALEQADRFRDAVLAWAHGGSATWSW